MTYQYKFLGRTISLVPDDEFVAVRFSDNVAKSMRPAVAYGAGLNNRAEWLEIPGEKYTLVPIGTLGGAMHAHSRLAGIESSLLDTEQVDSVMPVFRMGEDKIVATDRVLAEIAQDAETAFAFLKEGGCEVIGRSGDEYTIRIPSNGDPFDLANRLSENPGVKYAEPDLITLGKRLAVDDSEEKSAETEEFPVEFSAGVLLRDTMDDTSPFALSMRLRDDSDRVDQAGSGFMAGSMDASGPSVAPVAAGDPLQGQQYAASITKAIDAWKIQTGSIEIKIAILDDGVDLQHEDLKARIAGSYDSPLNISPLQPIPLEKHGTACAGLAAAVPKNGRGICGISNGCSLLAVRIGQPLSENSPYWKTDSDTIARGIDWARENGADVLSNSWGSAPSNKVYYAIERARTQGRGGKGAVIVCAAGNQSSPTIGFPAHLPHVLTVSASNQNDEFKTGTSSDGERWWGSNYGPEIGVSAPGVGNLTTDITGPSGYAPGNYYPAFNGTSSACPIVAGAAALVLSANPTLTEAQVRDLIQSTADKIESHRYPYVNGRNHQHGFGRLNVLLAVQRA